MSVRELLRRLRACAHTKNANFEVIKNRGKGGHQMVHFGDRKTTVPAPNKELKLGTLKAILKQLDIHDDEF